MNNRCTSDVFIYTSIWKLASYSYSSLFRGYRRFSTIINKLCACVCVCISMYIRSGQRKTVAPPVTFIIKNEWTRFKRFFFIFYLFCWKKLFFLTLFLFSPKCQVTVFRMLAFKKNTLSVCLST